MSEVMCFAALLFGNTRVVQIQWVHQFGTYCRRREIRSIYLFHDGMYYKCVIISCSFVYELAVSPAYRMLHLFMLLAYVSLKFGLSLTYPIQ